MKIGSIIEKLIANELISYYIPDRNIADCDVFFMTSDPDRVSLAGTLVLCTEDHEADVLDRAGERGAVAYIAEKRTDASLPGIIVSDAYAAASLLSHYIEKTDKENY